MNLQGHIQRISQEDAAVVEVDVQEPAAPVVEPVPEEAPALAADQLIEAEPAPDTAKAEIEETTAIVESLEQFTVLADQAAARGGFRAEEGMLFQTALEHFQKRLGVEHVNLGMEDFGGTMSRAKATAIAQENLKEVALAAKQKLQGLIGAEE